MSDERGGRRWGMYLIVLAILFVCALFLAHLVWSAGAGRSLRRQVAAIKASGEPIEFADYATTQPLSDEENGAIDLRDAYKAIDSTSELHKGFDRQTLDLPLVEKEAKILREVIQANQKAFEGVDAAMTRKGVDWRIAMTTPSINVLLPHLSEMRQLAFLVSCRAKLNFHEGDHAAVLRDMQRLQFLSDATAQPPTLLVTHLVAIGITALEVDNIQKMAPTLKIGDEPGAASKAEVAKLIAALLDDKKERENLIRAFQYERSFQLDAARCLADGTMNLSMLSGAAAARGAQSSLASALNFAVKPVALEDGGIMLRYDTALLEAIKKSPDWPTFNALKPGLPPELNNMRHLVLRVLLPSLERSVSTNLRSAAERHAAAMSLAARLYALEHGGKMPQSIDDLVPKYLPAAPPDPFSKAQTMKYVGLPTTQPIAYSVGENGKDDGGSENSRSGVPARNKWESVDIVTHLTPQPREYPPASDENPEDGGADADAQSIYPKETMDAVRAARAAERATSQPATTAPASQP